MLYFIAELFERYIEEFRPYNPVAIVDEFARAIDLETDFVIESNNVRRFQENFAKEKSIKIPEIYEDYSGRKVLVMEELKGIPLSQKASLGQEGIDPESVLRVGLKCYLKMVFTDGLFHGDPSCGEYVCSPK